MSSKTTRRKVVSDEAPDEEGPATRKVRKVVGQKTESEPPAPEVRQVKSPLAARKSAASKSWDDLFTARDSANYEKALGETRQALAEDVAERTLLRTLQTDGWNAKQARHIVNEAKS